MVYFVVFSGTLGPTRSASLEGHVAKPIRDSLLTCPGQRYVGQRARMNGDKLGTGGARVYVYVGILVPDIINLSTRGMMAHRT